MRPIIQFTRRIVSGGFHLLLIVLGLVSRCNGVDADLFWVHSHMAREQCLLAGRLELLGSAASPNYHVRFMAHVNAASTKYGYAPARGQGLQCLSQDFMALAI
jgi:hypothetical protein